MANKALDKKKETRTDTVTLESGVEVRVQPVSSAVIQAVLKDITNPVVPVWHNPDTGRDEKNPNDPEYMSALADNMQKRVVASLDAFTIFGITLVNWPIEDKTWLKKLSYMSKMGYLQLSEFDLDDEEDLRFLYKKYIAVTTADLVALSNSLNVTDEGVAEQADSFPGDEEQDADPASEV